MIEFKMPSLGADMEAGVLREWRVQPGDTVKRGDIIADVETQKGLIEIEVFEDGLIDKLLINEDEKVPVGTLMALIKPDGEVTRAKVEEAIEEEKVVEPVRKPLVEPGVEVEKPAAELVSAETMVAEPPKREKRVRISPLAKKIAEQNSINYHEIEGSGEEGAIVKDDIERIMAEKEPEAAVEEKEAAPDENIRKAIAAAMSKSNLEIPHYYLEMKIDMEPALNWLAEINNERPVEKRVLPIALLISAVSKALKEVPELNAIWEDGIQLKEEINPGLVIALRKGGVVVPAICHADQKKAVEIMEVLTDLIPRAKALNLRSSELGTATISITSIGDEGADSVYGIIYPPQVALVGFGSIREEVWAENGKIDIRRMIRVTLAADHRATDGHTGDLFLIALRNLLLNPVKL